MGWFITLQKKRDAGEGWFVPYARTRTRHIGSLELALVFFATPNRNTNAKKVGYVSEEQKEALRFFYLFALSLNTIITLRELMG